MDKPVAVTVKILGVDYRIACEEGEKEALIASAKYLDEKMQDVKSTGKVIGGERVAVMAALNISHELLQQKFVDHDKNKMIKNRLGGLQERIEIALEDSSPVLI